MFEIKDLIMAGINDGKDKTKLLNILAESIDEENSKIKTFEKLYYEVYETKLCDSYCVKLVEEMHHDGITGKKWTIDQTNDVARKLGISFSSDTYSQYEFWAVMHMMYYDYHKTLEESGISDASIYGKLADDYLDDEDAPKGKLVNYFFFVEQNRE